MLTTRNCRKYMPLAWLPNQVGFRFIAFCKDGTERECVVTTRPHCTSFLHTVEGYADLVDMRCDNRNTLRVSSYDLTARLGRDGLYVGQ